MKSKTKNKNNRSFAISNTNIHYTKVPGSYQFLFPLLKGKNHEQS